MLDNTAFKITLQNLMILQLDGTSPRYSAAASRRNRGS